MKDCGGEMYNEIINELLNFEYGAVAKVVFSDSNTKVTLKPILLKKNKAWQCERIVNNKAFHENIPDSELGAFVEKLLSECQFKNINIFTIDRVVSFRITKKNKVFRSETAAETKKPVELNHDRGKNYILADGMPIQPLVDLGVFTKDFHIVKSKHDKFRQINKFIEIIASGLRDYNKSELTIVDFGCGKSYLTFIVYYYFVFIKNIDVKIIGYDLKSEVVADCNRIAEKYGYNNLSFVEGDVTKTELYTGDVDMIITLHACDIATDYALAYAIKRKIKRIFSVPCCQHEINAQISCNDEYSILLRHGLYKERFSALLTDCIRCEVLSNAGYDVDVIDFVDFSNTPKNAMIRANYTGKGKRDYEDDNLKKIAARFGIDHTLLRLLPCSPDIHS